MFFHTWTFFLFFLVFYVVYLAIKNTKFKDIWLLTASYTFYGWWNPFYLLLIAYSTLLDYSMVRLMEKYSSRKKTWVAVSVVNIILLQCIFKYANFLTENLNSLLSSVGFTGDVPMPDIMLPVGISFFTFQSMSYTIDFYRGKLKAEHNIIRFATFVSLFPQLVAGPIERATNLLPQLQGKPVIRRQDISDGLSLFLVGFFKKVALADYLVIYVNKIYGKIHSLPQIQEEVKKLVGVELSQIPEKIKNVEVLQSMDPSLLVKAAEQVQNLSLFDLGQNLGVVIGTPALLLGTFAFAWVIYFDFSGYTDMARGIARLMGFRLMLNFNNPYLSKSLGEFWGRWHISLSSWFKEYVYIPLGGNRGGSVRLYINIFITMVVSGLWHGAAWTFIIWGALHAIGRIITRELERTDFYNHRIPDIVKQLGIFVFVCFAWVFFRAENLDEAILVLRGIASCDWVDPEFPALMFILIMAVWAYQYLFESKMKWIIEFKGVRLLMVLGMLIYLVLVPSAGPNTFIYFQF